METVSVRKAKVELSRLIASSWSRSLPLIPTYC